MALPDVNFALGNQVNGQPLPGEDYISGLVIYTGSIPALWPSSGMKQLFSVGDAEAAGIKGDYNDETKATGTIQITHIGAAGDTIEIKVVEPFQTVSLGVYTLVSTDTTVNITAASINAFINANQYITGGYTSTVATDTITLSARPGLGIALNTGTNLLKTIVSSALTATLVQFSGGVCSKQAVWHYHISEFFRQIPNGVLWVGMFAVPGTFTGSEVSTLQVYASGKIRQCGVYIDQHAYTAADLTALQVIATALDAAHQPLNIIVGANFQAVSDLSTLADTSALSNKNVSISLGQDGAAAGALLFYAYGKSITQLGALLGSVANSKVSQSVANPSTQFNISNGTENEVAAFANGNLFRTITSTQPSLLTQLDNYHYIFARKFVGYNGTYHSGEWTCIAPNNNYCHISDNRVVQKIERLLYPAFLPTVLQQEIQLNADGTIFFPVVKALESTGENALGIMGTNSEVSAVEVLISPTQNLKTSTVFQIVVNYVQNFIARSVTVTINKVTSLS